MFNGGNANLYAYVHDSPMDRSDPTGLFDDQPLPMPPVPSKTLPVAEPPKLDTGVTLTGGSDDKKMRGPREPEFDRSKEPEAPPQMQNPALFNDPGEDMTRRQDLIDGRLQTRLSISRFQLRGKIFLSIRTARG